MSSGVLALLIFSQLLLVGSQIFLKHGVNLTKRRPIPWVTAAMHFSLWLGAMILWFRFWLGFLQTMPLSKVLPWEGIGPVLLLIGAALFLREKISRAAWLGMLLISAGVFLVSLS
jgi:undecaprenyl phosphate-alpha-L-ara4N flippase subunit ArnE